MSNDIKAGDLVQVIKASPCCGNTEAIGDILLIDSVLNGWTRCGCCSNISETNIATFFADGGNHCLEVNRLKKIPPLSNLEDVSTQRQDLLPNEQKETV